MSRGRAMLAECWRCAGDGMVVAVTAEGGVLFLDPRVCPTCDGTGATRIESIGAKLLCDEVAAAWALPRGYTLAEIPAVEDHDHDEIHPRRLGRLLGALRRSRLGGSP